MMETKRRLIYMDDTMDKLRAYAERKHEAGHTELANGILKAVNYIHNNIVRVDAVEVVRCKDCQSFEQKWSWDNLNTGKVECCGYCYHWDYEQGMSPNQVDGDDFCSYGERRTEDGKGNL